MRKPIPALVALAVLGPLLLLAAPADAASRYSVSVAVGADRADVGQGVVLSGKVGPKAKGERVKVQRLVGTAWTTVARVKLNRHSRYTATVTVAAPGDNLFRVLKPRSDGHKAGASPTVTATAALSGLRPVANALGCASSIRKTRGIGSWARAASSATRS